MYYRIRGVFAQCHGLSSPLLPSAIDHLVARKKTQEPSKVEKCMCYVWQFVLPILHLLSFIHVLACLADIKRESG